MAGGRQLTFDKQQVLDKAMKVFWQKGYVGTSLSELTQCMGINKPSLYSTFGNKEELFLQATQHYIKYYGSDHQKHLKEKELSLYERVYRYMHSIVTQQCQDDTPKGCYISLSVSECAGEAVPPLVAEMIDSVKYAHEKLLTALFNDEKEQGNLSQDFNSEVAALFLLTTLHGTATLARSGKNIKDLDPVIKTALSILL